MSDQFSSPPKGYGTITPYLIVDDGAKAIEFYCKLFEAKEVMRFEMEGGKIAHAEIEVGGNRLMIGEAHAEEGLKSPKTLGGISGGIHLYTTDVDKLYEEALKAGATSLKKPQDQFWGDRSATIVDPFGHRWNFATQKEELSNEEVQKRMASTGQES